MINGDFLVFIILNNTFVFLVYIELNKILPLIPPISILRLSRKYERVSFFHNFYKKRQLQVSPKSSISFKNYSPK